jgi:glycosyltransferase involved in cell wall biosynthesis
VIEAMAYRRPVVVTEAGGMPELVRDGVDGLVVPVRDPEALALALDRIARDPELAKTFGNNGHQRISTDFNTDATVKQTLELYQELTDELHA